MKSTGEVMGVGETFGEAFVKSQLAAGVKLPAGRQGLHQRARRRQARRGADRARPVELGFTLLATRGTAAVLKSHGIPVTPVNKVAEGRPHIVDMIKNGEIELHRQHGRGDAHRDLATRARSAPPRWPRRVTYYTTVAGAKAACAGMKHLAQLEPYRLQELHAKLAFARAIAGARCP